MNLDIEKFDVKNAFLYGDLEEEICMKQLEGFKVKHRAYAMWVDKEFIGTQVSTEIQDSGIRIWLLYGWG